MSSLPAPVRRNECPTCNQHGELAKKYDLITALELKLSQSENEVRLLEERESRLREIFSLDRIHYIHNYFRGVVSTPDPDHIQSREDSKLHDITLEMRQYLKQIEQQKESDETK